jgi:hypothetical protein
MSKTITFSVSKSGQEPVEVSREFPENLEDPKWADVVSDAAEDIQNLAEQAWVVKCQAGARNHLEAGPDAVQQYVDSYKFGARAGGFRAPTMSQADVKKAKFSPEQLEIMRKAGMRFETEAA